MVFIGSLLAGSSALSSSDRPFLNDLMPLAKSPISSEILPRPPNSSSPTASTMIQCQMLIEPMRISSVATGPHGPMGPHGPAVQGDGPNLGAAAGKNKDFATRNSPAPGCAAAQAAGSAAAAATCDN